MATKSKSKGQLWRCSEVRVQDRVKRVERETLIYDGHRHVLARTHAMALTDTQITVRLRRQTLSAKTMDDSSPTSGEDR